MKPLSILVPHLGSDADFETTLASVLRSRPDNAQVIVMTDDQYTDPHGVGQDVQWCISPSRRWVDQWNLAVEQIDNEWTIVLAAGVRLEDEWYEAFDRLASDSVAAVSPIIVDDSAIPRFRISGVSVKRDGSIRPVLSAKPSEEGCKSTRIDAPGILAGAWRSALVKSMAPWDKFWTFDDLGIDLAHAIRASHLPVTSAASWVVSVSESSQRVNALFRPHGTASERCLRRHRSRSGGRSDQGLYVRVASDLIAGATRPWRLVQAWQRLGAGKFRREDKRFQQFGGLVTAVDAGTGGFERKLTKAA